MSVTDGDTVKVQRGDDRVKVRLYGIDAPEKKQAFGKEAKVFSTGLAAGKSVTVEEKAKDRYGRTVGIVTFEDGRSLNLDILNAGYAWWYRDYAPKAKDYQSAETGAKDEKLGLWEQDDPMPPWAWRKAQKKRKAYSIPSLE